MPKFRLYTYVKGLYITLVICFAERQQKNLKKISKKQKTNTQRKQSMDWCKHFEIIPKWRRSSWMRKFVYILHVWCVALAVIVATVGYLALLFENLIPNLWFISQSGVVSKWYVYLVIIRMNSIANDNMANTEAKYVLSQLLIKGHSEMAKLNYKYGF